MDSLLGEFVSLLAGIATGFVFERRSTNGIRKSNESLQRQISVLKTSVFSLNGRPESAQVARPVDDLAALVTERAIATQDPGGRVSKHALIAHFIECEYPTREINAVIASICETGIAKEDGPWLQMA